jgi:hypothetical protein
MPEGNAFLGEVAAVEVLAKVLAMLLAVGSLRAVSFGRRLSWSHRGIVRTAH